MKNLLLAILLLALATALFANSPFLEGKPNGFLSFRSHIWLNTDKDRTGMLPFAFEEGFGFEHYDGVGAFRAEDGNKPVDASGELPELGGQVGVFRPGGSPG